MSYLNRYTSATLVREVGLLIVAVIWWIPFYVLITHHAQVRRGGH